MWKTLLISIFLITSCTNLKIKTANRPKISPQTNESVDQTQIVEAKVPKKIGVIVGPGGAKSMAAAGVLKVLHEEGVEIEYVSGIGWGSLPAAIYAKNAKPHELAWQFYKLKKLSLMDSNFFGVSKKQLDTKKVKSYLDQIFTSKNIQSFALPFACTGEHDSVAGIKGRLFLSDKAVTQLLKCLNVKPMLSNDGWAGSLNYGYLLDHFQSKGYNFIIHINNLKGQKAEDWKSVKLSSDDVRHWNSAIYDADHYSAEGDRAVTNPDLLSMAFNIDIDTKGIGILDFNKSKELIQMGEKAARSNLKSLLKALKK